MFVSSYRNMCKSLGMSVSTAFFKLSQTFCVQLDYELEIFIA